MNKNDVYLGLNIRWWYRRECRCSKENCLPSFAWQTCSLFWVMPACILIRNNKKDQWSQHWSIILMCKMHNRFPSDHLMTFAAFRKPLKAAGEKMRFSAGLKRTCCTGIKVEIMLNTSRNQANTWIWICIPNFSRTCWPEIGTRTRITAIEGGPKILGALLLV